VTELVFTVSLKDQVLEETQKLIDFPNARIFLPQTPEVNF